MASPYRLDHLAVHVSDMEASVAFYSGLLGLPEIENPMGNASVRWLAIDAGHALHLLPGGEKAVRTIQTHLALAAADFDATVARLTAAGAAFGELPSRPGKVSQRRDGVRQSFVCDPDGYWVEINDATPRSKNLSENAPS